MTLHQEVEARAVPTEVFAPRCAQQMKESDQGQRAIGLPGRMGRRKQRRRRTVEKAHENSVGKRAKSRSHKASGLRFHSDDEEEVGAHTLRVLLPRAQAIGAVAHLYQHARRSTNSKTTHIKLN